MNNTEIIQHIKKKIPPKERENIRATTMREPDGWHTAIMLRYSGGEGLGFMGSSTFLDVKFNTESSAQKLVDRIHKEFRTY